MFLIARPQGKAQQTAAVFEKALLSAHALPLLTIEIAQGNTLYSQLHSAKPRCIIVTSTYAAKWLLQSTANIDVSRMTFTHITFICVGKSTAKAITDSGILAKILVAEPENSEGILKLPFLTRPENINVALIKGEGGRDLISSTLRTRGANVVELNVYKRVANIPAIHALTFEPSQIRCIITTSIEITQLLLANMNHEWLTSCKWIVASQRIKDYVAAFGIQHILVSQGASDEALLASAKQLVNTGVSHD
jgi:uroporphyrinogen-III synthase